MRREVLIRWVRGLTVLFGGWLFLKAFKGINRILRNLTLQSHRIQFFLEWKLLPNPEWFDHYMDLYYQWKKFRNPLWIERGIFNLLAVKNGGALLELCCGDGFNSYYFYSIRGKNIVSVDFDRGAITHAKKNHRADNIRFGVSDIRTEMPVGQFDNVIIDAAIEHFTESEIVQILKGVKERLKVGGILSGYTIVEKDDGSKSLHQHEYEFKSKDDLAGFLVPHFKNVKVFETIYPSRHNLYFFASDSTLPFDDNWEFMRAIRKTG